MINLVGPAQRHVQTTEQMPLEQRGSFWRCAGASVAGTSHLKSGSVCQDAIAASAWPTRSDDDVLVMISADGAGAARFSKEAAQLITQQLTIFARRHLLYGGEVHDITREMVSLWLSQTRAMLEIRASRSGTRLSDYASTLSVAIVGQSHAAFFQIGDGAIVIGLQNSPWHYGWVFWPERGEYANTTYFLSDRDFESNLHFEMLKVAVSEISVFTDGLQDLLLSYQTHQVHQPFFRKIFLPLRNRSATEDELNTDLSTFLQSDAINRRTSDDKSLMLASRI